MLREQIVAEIMKLVTPAIVPMDHKPSIEELEKILNSDEVPKIHMQPDGSISTEKPHTVGDIADAVLRVVGDVRAAALREAMERIQAECGCCGGSGHDPGSTEANPMQCEYCGRPMYAIQSLMQE